MWNLFILPLLVLLLLVGFQCEESGNDNVIEWVYSDKKETFTDYIVQYFVKKENSLNIYTAEIMQKNESAQDKKKSPKDIKKASKKKNLSSHADSNVGKLFKKWLSSPDNIKYMDERFGDLFANEDNTVITIEKLFNNLYKDTTEEKIKNPQNTSSDYENTNEKATMNSFSEMKQRLLLREDAENINNAASSAFEKQKKCQNYIIKNSATFFSLVTYVADNDIIAKGFELLKEYPSLVTLENISDLRQYKYVHHMFDKFSENDLINKNEESKTFSVKADKEEFIGDYEAFLNDMINEIVTVYLEKKSFPLPEKKNEENTFSHLKNDEDQIIVENDNIIEDFAKILLTEVDEKGDDKNEVEKENEETKKIKISLDSAFIQLKENASKRNKNVEEDDEINDYEIDEEDEEDEEEEVEDDDSDEKEEGKEEEEEEEEKEKEEKVNKKIKKVTKINEEKKMKLKMNLEDIKKKFGSDFLDESTGESESMIYQANVLDRLTEQVKKEEPNRHESLIKEASEEGSGLNEKDTETNILERKKRKLDEFKNYEQKVLKEIHEEKNSVHEMIDTDLDKLLKPAQKEYLKLVRNTRNKLFHEYQDILKEELNEP